MSLPFELGFAAAPVGEPGLGDAALYEEILVDCQVHRDLGYTAAWVLEHHFSDYFPMPGPLLVLAHIAGRFPDLSLGTCVLVTPWYEPRRLAGEISALTHLTRQHVHLGIGRGTAKYEYDAFGVEMQEARERFRECWEVLDLALTGEPFTYRGDHIRIEQEIRIRPAPVRERVTFYGAIGTAPSAPLMAELGLPPICTSIGDFAAQRATLEAWNERAAELRLETSPVRPILVNAIVAEKTAALLDCGFNHLIVHTSTPGVPRAVRQEWSSRFARDVAPRFLSAQAQSPA